MDEEKRKVYEVITDCWKCVREYGFQQMTDSDWEKLIDSENELNKKWMKGQDKQIYKNIYKSLMSSLLGAIETIQREGKNG